MTGRAKDNWGWRARVGLLIVASEPVPEAEWWAMAPDGVSVHAARIAASTPWAEWTADRTTVDLQPDLARAVEHFAAMRLDAVVIAHSSSSIVGGSGWDEAVVGKLSTALPAGTRVSTNGHDCRDALHAVGSRRPFLVIPAWFDDAFLPTAEAYFRNLGFDPAGHVRVDPGRGWRDFPPRQLYPQGMAFAQDVEALYRQVRQACPSDCDGILFVGTGLRCVGIIDALESDLGRPVVTANQASLWSALRASGVSIRVDGYGALLRDHGVPK